VLDVGKDMIDELFDNEKEGLTDLLGLVPCWLTFRWSTV
jgi:hypothetical protein